MQAVIGVAEKTKTCIDKMNEKIDALVYASALKDDL